MNWRTRQSPETWGTLSDQEWAWAQQFGQSLSWDEYQSIRQYFKPGMSPDPILEVKLMGKIWQHMTREERELYHAKRQGVGIS